MAGSTFPDYKKSNLCKSNFQFISFFAPGSRFHCRLTLYSNARACLKSQAGSVAIRKQNLKNSNSTAVPRLAISPCSCIFNRIVEQTQHTRSWKHLSRLQKKTSELTKQVFPRLAFPPSCKHTAVRTLDSSRLDRLNCALKQQPFRTPPSFWEHSTRNSCGVIFAVWLKPSTRFGSLFRCTYVSRPTVHKAVRTLDSSRLEGEKEHQIVR